MKQKLGSKLIVPHTSQLYMHVTLAHVHCHSLCVPTAFRQAASLFLVVLCSTFLLAHACFHVPPPAEDTCSHHKNVPDAGLKCRSSRSEHLCIHVNPSHRYLQTHKWHPQISTPNTYAARLINQGCQRFLSRPTRNDRMLEDKLITTANPGLFVV